MSATAFVGDDWAEFAKGEPEVPPLKLTAPKPKRPSQGKRREQDFADQCRSYLLPTVIRKHLFAKSIGRRWEFDFAFPEYHLAVEIEGLAVRKIGGVFVCTGRHTTPKGFEGDCEKYATAVLLGWTVVRFMTKQAAPGRNGAPSYAIQMTQRILYSRGWKGANA
jgi:hypothetical protein